MTDTTTADTRTPEEIERDIRTTQAEMSRTVEQIGGNLGARQSLAERRQGRLLARAEQELHQHDVVRCEALLELFGLTREALE